MTSGTAPVSLADIQRPLRARLERVQLEIRRILEVYNFAPDSLQVTGMLDEIRAEASKDPAPSGERYPRVFRMKHAHAFAGH